MVTLLAYAAEIPPAAVFGVAGLLGQLAWPLFRSRESMLTVQLVTACSYSASYSLMHQNTATAVCLAGATQTTLALLAGERPWLARVGYVFLPIVLTVGLLTWSGLPTILAITACCLTMIGRLQPDTVRMRSVQLTASPFGAAHDIMVGAWPCLLGAFLSFAIASAGLRRELHGRRALAAT